MLFEISLAVLLGIIAGIFTGLFPGIHINLVSATLLAFLAYLSKLFSPLALAGFIVSMSVTHIFFDFIPSVYLGAPDESGLATLPGHAMLLRGNGHKAVCLAIYGAYFSILISILILPILFLALPKIYPFIERMMAWLLIVASGFLIFHEKNSRPLALVIFILSAILGIIALNVNISQPLLPLLSGLFGSSTLLFSLSKKTSVPEQNLKFNFDKKDFIKPMIANSAVAPLCSFLPGMGGSQAAIISSEFCKPTQEQFLILLGGVSAIVMTLSFPVLFILEKARTGSAAAIQDLLKVSFGDLMILILISLIAGTLAFFLSLKASKIFAQKINSLPYSLLSIITLFILSVLVILFSGLLGFTVYLASTCLGMLAIYFEIRKGHLMACLLVPAIIFYL
jgi:putative membrane protein